MTMAPHEQGIKKHVRIVLETLFPSFCVGCGILLQEGSLCHSCRNLLARGGEVRCPVCEKRIPRARVCEPCRTKSGLAYFLAAGSYHNPLLKEAIHDMKYRFIQSLAQPLGDFLARTISAICKGNPVFHSLVPLAVPLHEKRLKWRGFNQAELIAREVALRLELPPGPDQDKHPWLIRARQGEDQVSLDLEQRWANVAGVFEVPAASVVQGKRILLIDDVFTTGATMGEAAKTLRRAGAKEIWGAVVARG